MTLAKASDTVFAVAPPEQTSIPSRDSSERFKLLICCCFPKINVFTLVLSVSDSRRSVALRPGWYSKQRFHTELSSLGGKLVACQEADGTTSSQQALRYDSYQHQIGFVQSSGCPGSPCPAMHHGGIWPA